MQGADLKQKRALVEKISEPKTIGRSPAQLLGPICTYSTIQIADWEQIGCACCTLHLWASTPLLPCQLASLIPPCVADLLMANAASYKFGGLLPPYPALQ